MNDALQRALATLTEVGLAGPTDSTVRVETAHYITSMNCTAIQQHQTGARRQIHGVSAFAACRHRAGISYTAVMEWTGPAAVAAVLDAAQAASTLCPSSFTGYPSREGHLGHHGVLELLDETGTPQDQRCSPTAATWAWWVRAVELRATASDCAICEPAAFAAVYGPGAMTAR